LKCTIKILKIKSKQQFSIVFLTFLILFSLIVKD